MPDGDGVLVCRLDGVVCAVQSVCPHRGAPLAEGTLHGAVLTCPWHGASFDVRTGRRLRGPECADLRRYAADGTAWVER
jgi:nitrite reductase/ring-hydroxylating ferredoxin subunit